MAYVLILVQQKQLKFLYNIIIVRKFLSDMMIGCWVQLSYIY